MIDVVDFFFQLLNDLWTCITSYWVLSIAVLITVIGWIVDLVKSTKQD